MSDTDNGNCDKQTSAVTDDQLSALLESDHTELRWQWVGPCLRELLALRARNQELEDAAWQTSEEQTTGTIKELWDENRSLRARLEALTAMLAVLGTDEEYGYCRVCDHVPEQASNDGRDHYPDCALRGTDAGAASAELHVAELLVARMRSLSVSDEVLQVAERDLARRRAAEKEQT